MVEAEELASVVVGALGFSLGCGYSVKLIQITEEDGTPHVWGVQPENPERQGDTLGYNPHQEIFNRTLRLAARDVYFRMAIRDYLQAINDIGDCAMYFLDLPRFSGQFPICAARSARHACVRTRSASSSR